VGLLHRDAEHSRLPQPPDEALRNSVAWQELQRSFLFFHKSAGANRLAYLGLRTTVLVAGALVPIMALATSRQTVVAGLGALIVVAEGLAQLTQVHDHWVRYRHTAEALRREAIAFASGAGVYGSGEQSGNERLVARILDLEAEENAGWEETVRAEGLKSHPAPEQPHDAAVIEMKPSEP
jgi:hypothetical protein